VSYDALVERRPADDRPRATVILPLFNAGDRVRGCFDRLYKTMDDDVELIVVDDGSSDNTSEIALDATVGMPRVVILRTAVNLGVAAARNQGLTHARGEFVWFVDWDDTWDPDILRLLADEATSTSADIVVCRAERSGNSAHRGELLDGMTQVRELDGPGAFDELLVGAIRGYLWSKLFRRELLPIPMFPLLSSASDLAGVAPVLAAARKVRVIPDTLYFHETRVGSITNTRSPNLENLYACDEVVRRVAESLPPAEGRSRRLAQFRYRYLFGSVAHTALRLRSDKSHAQEALRRVSSEMRLREILSLTFTDPVITLRSLLVKGLGARYQVLYDLIIFLRRVLRPAT
jgi:glycosyltransferase involved in cell wall biosynthesis